jgi:hypothetical protein
MQTLTAKKPVKLAGSIDWINRDETQGKVQVLRALLRPTELVLECVFDDARYTVHLKPMTKNIFSGTFDRDHEKDAGSVNCKLYSNEDEYFLQGTWVEDGTEFHFWSELEVVERFSDEVAVRE